MCLSLCYFVYNDATTFPGYPFLYDSSISCTFSRWIFPVDLQTFNSGLSLCHRQRSIEVGVCAGEKKLSSINGLEGLILHPHKHAYFAKVFHFPGTHLHIFIHLFIPVGFRTFLNLSSIILFIYLLKRLSCQIDLIFTFRIYFIKLSRKNTEILDLKLQSVSFTILCYRFLCHNHAYPHFPCSLHKLTLHFRQAPFRRSCVVTCCSKASRGVWNGAGRFCSRNMWTRRKTGGQRMNHAH